MDRISVIIPAYNAEKYLERCLDSVLCQTYPHLEIIVIDDGSQDTTGKMIDTMAAKDPRIVPLHQKNAGAAKARLAGIRRATGEYLTFVDADDTIDSTMLEYLLKLLQTTESQIACCQYRLFNEKSAPPTAVREGAVRTYCLDEAIRNLYQDTLWSLWGKLYQRSLFDENRLMVQPLRVGEDLLLACSLYRQCDKITVSEAKLYYYFRHSGSVMAQSLNSTHIRDSMTAYQQIAQSLDKDSKAYEYHMQNLLSNDFGFLNRIILTDSCHECYNEIRQEILKYRRFAFINKDNPTLNSRHRLGVVLLQYCPPLFNIMIKIKG